MSFEYRRVEGDVRVDPGTMVLAGGTDLMPLHKVGLIDPDAVLDIKTSDLPADISHADGRWRLGALTTLAELEDHEGLRSTFPAVGDAVRQAATRQIRNRATVGGNLLQRPRCRYYRDEHTTCWFAGGDDCPARGGQNAHHAIFDTDEQAGSCVAVQPSDLASVLVALDAEVVVDGAPAPGIRVADLLRAPTDDHRSMHGLRPDQVIEAIEIVERPGRVSTYRKAMDRAAWQFALAGIAATVVTDESGEIAEARLVASGVANTPWRLSASEESLIGTRLSVDTIAGASALADRGAEPLEHNGYKRSLLRGLVRRALEDLESGSRNGHP